MFFNFLKIKIFLLEMTKRKSKKRITIDNIIQDVKHYIDDNLEQIKNVGEYSLDKIQTIFVEPYAYSHIKLKDLVDMHSQLSDWGIISD